MVDALAFDAGGNLWVANDGPGSNTLVEFTTSQLAASGSPTPAVTLSANAGSINTPQGLAFDHGGNLWMTNFGPPAAVAAFSASQLASSGCPAPTVTLSDDGASSLKVPEDLAFDGGGNLGVADCGASTVVAFASSQLRSTGCPTPVVTLTSSGAGVLNCPTALAFDTHGNL